MPTRSTRAARYCVYAHCLNEEVIYIGSGKRTRPYDFCSRNPLWCRKVGRSAVDVVILSRHRSEHVARSIERDLILKIQPTCNLQLLTGSFLETLRIPRVASARKPVARSAVRE